MSAGDVGSNPTDQYFVGGKLNWYKHTVDNREIVGS